MTLVYLDLEFLMTPTNWTNLINCTQKLDTIKNFLEFVAPIPAHSIPASLVDADQQGIARMLVNHHYGIDAQSVILAVDVKMRRRAFQIEDVQFEQGYVVLEIYDKTQNPDDIQITKNFCHTIYGNNISCNCLCVDKWDECFKFFAGGRSLEYRLLPRPRNYDEFKQKLTADAPSFVKYHMLGYNNTHQAINYDGNDTIEIDTKSADWNKRIEVAWKKYSIQTENKPSNKRKKLLFEALIKNGKIEKVCGGDLEALEDGESGNVEMEECDKDCPLQWWKELNKKDKKKVKCPICQCGASGKRKTFWSDLLDHPLHNSVCIICQEVAMENYHLNCGTCHTTVFCNNCIGDFLEKCCNVAEDKEQGVRAKPRVQCPSCQKDVNQNPDYYFPE